MEGTVQRVGLATLEKVGQELVSLNDHKLWKIYSENPTFRQPIVTGAHLIATGIFSTVTAVQVHAAAYRISGRWCLMQ